MKPWRDYELQNDCTGCHLNLVMSAWRNGDAKKGKHLLRAIVIDAKGRKAEAQRYVRICR